MSKDNVPNFNQCHFAHTSSSFFCFPKNENHNPMPFVLSCLFFLPFLFFSEEGAFPGIRKWKADVWGPSLRAPLLQNKMGEKEEDKREGGSSCFV